MDAVPIVSGRIEGRPPVVVLVRGGGVPDDFWHALPVRIGAVAPGQFSAEDALQVPIERFLSGRLWLLEHCRSYRVGLDLDDSLRFALARERNERAFLSELLSAGTAADDPEVDEVLRNQKSRLTRTLREFQLRDLKKMLRLPHGANFSVPGAGKTTVCYALYDAERARGRVTRMLVVAPISAFEAWETEGQFCFSAPPVTRRFNGPIPTDTEVLLVNYQKLKSPYYEQIVKWIQAAPTQVVLDEAHRMKRGNTGEWGRACLQLAHVAERRDILTGTPAPHSPRDLVALLDYVWPGQARDILPPIALVADPPAGSMELVNRAIQPLFVRTTKHELGLTPPTLRTETVALDGLQAEVYDALRNRYAGMFDLTRDDRITLAQMGEVMMYLLEAATNPALLAKSTPEQLSAQVLYPSLSIPPGSSIGTLVRDYPRYEVPPKFIHVARLVEANAQLGRKTLVWSNFIGNLLTLERVLARHRPALVYGGIPSIPGPAPAGVRTREGELTRFRADDSCAVLLANPAALAEGVSLHDVCHDAVYIDRTFNAGQYLQSLDRIHRLGLPAGEETRITFLVSEGTIDERVDERVRVKAERLGAMLDDPDLVEMALPDDEDYGEPIQDAGDLEALLGHLRSDE